MKVYGKVAVWSHSFLHTPNEEGRSTGSCMHGGLYQWGIVWEGSTLAGLFGEKKNVLRQLGIEPRLLGCPDRNVVAALTAPCHYDMMLENTI